MFRFNLSDPFGLAMMVAVAIASIGGGVVITILLDAIRERRYLRRMAQEFLAFAERIELALTPCVEPKIGYDDWIEDDSAWDMPEEDFAEWEVRSVEEADNADYLDYVKRRLRHVEDYIDAIERYQIDLIWHPDCREGRDALPKLAWKAECLRVEQDQLRKELDQTDVVWY
jgi:hypothetical protein